MRFSKAVALQVIAFVVVAAVVVLSVIAFQILVDLHQSSAQRQAELAKVETLAKQIRAETQQIKAVADSSHLDAANIRAYVEALTVVSYDEIFADQAVCSAEPNCHITFPTIHAEIKTGKVIVTETPPASGGK